jgi:hypothetical protein
MAPANRMTRYDKEFQTGTDEHEKAIKPLDEAAPPRPPDAREGNAAPRRRSSDVPKKREPGDRRAR